MKRLFFCCDAVSDDDANGKTFVYLFSFSAFARYPNGVVVHYFCCKDRTVCPTEQ